MKKILLATGALLWACSTALAVPAMQQRVEVTQPDGSQLTLGVDGDEFGHVIVTRDGLAVAKDNSGSYCYLAADGLTTVMAHDPELRSAIEKSFLAREARQLKLGTLMNEPARRLIKAVNAQRLQSQVPHSGSPRIPILLVQYKDKAMSHTKDDFVAQYTQGAASVNQYFQDQSNGKYNPRFDVFGIYTLDNTRETYGKDSGTAAKDAGVARMVAEACEKAQAEGKINWTDYDNNGDGDCDVVIVVYAGVGEAQATLTVPNSIWPCQWNLTEAAHYGDGPGALTYAGTKVDKFAVFNEVNGSDDSGTKMDGIGTFCHEFSHCLGLPDFYETTYMFGYVGMDCWSLLDYGCYNNGGYTPIGYNAYEKNYMGWLDLATPVGNTRYVLPRFNQGSDSTDVAVKITSELNSNEYYILENRAKQGWDSYIPDEGVLITHVSYVPSRWDKNTVNNEKVQLMTFVPADAVASHATVSTDLYGKSNHSFTDGSAPKADLYLAADGTIDGNAGMLGKPVTDINLNADGTASFWYIKKVEKHDRPVLTTPTQLTASSFTAHWQPVDSTQAHYTLWLYDTKQAPSSWKIITENLADGATTWTESNKGTYKDKGYLRLGTSQQCGSITSPEIDLTACNAVTTVAVAARAYGYDKGVAMKVSWLDESGNAIDTHAETLASNDSVYIFKLTGQSTTSNVLRIENTEAKKRVQLKHVDIYAGDVAASLMAGLPVAVPDSSQLSVGNIADTCYTVQGLDSNRTYACQVQAVYPDGSLSPWSQQLMVNLQGTGLRGDLNGDGQVNVTDVSVIINAILGNGQLDLEAGDLNGDGSLNVTDVTALIHIILQ